MKTVIAIMRIGLAIGASYRLRITIAVSCLLLARGAWAEDAAKTVSPKPNIVLVFIDDMGWGDLSCFGNKDTQTPNIDRLASEGLRFEQFYVNSPICSPSRVAISTGQYPQRWSITSYLDNSERNRQRGMANWLDPKAPMLARFLQQAGYATGHFGKWHMGGQRDVDYAPPITDYGFDESLTNFEGMGPKLLPLILAPGQKEPTRIWADAERLGAGYRWMLRSKITGGYVDAALEFVKKAKEDGKPFYINVWPDDVHGRYCPPVDKWGDGSERTRYLAVLVEMDRQLGTLFDTIKRDPELKANTLILFCSDNGPHTPGSAGPFRGRKTMLFEGGVRSPLIVWGPGLLAPDAAGTVNTKSVFSAIDLNRSLYAIAGIAPPDATLDGEDVSGTMLGRSNASRQAPIFFGRPPDRKNFYGVKNLPDLSVRQGRWKLLCDYDGSDLRLFHLNEDIGETANVAVQHPEVAKRLTDAVVDWYKSMPKTPPEQPKPASWKDEWTGGARWRAPDGSTVSASHCFGNDSVRAMADRIEPTGSSDRSNGKHTFWPHKGTKEWVQVEFPEPDRRAASVSVYWYDDTGRGGCRVPESWVLEYKEGAEWKPVETKDPYGTQTDRFNTVSFSPVQMQALRIRLKLQKGYSGGVLEWKID